MLQQTTSPLPLWNLFEKSTLESNLLKITLWAKNWIKLNLLVKGHHCFVQNSTTSKEKPSIALIGFVEKHQILEQLREIDEYTE